MCKNTSLEYPIYVRLHVAQSMITSDRATLCTCT